MHDFLNRCRPFFQEQGLQILAEKTIVISGLGGVGGGAFLALVRSGCSSFRLAENGLFDPPDMNRQAAAFGHTMDRPKLDVYVELARSINPAIRIETWPEGLQPENIEEIISGSDVHIGAIDVEKGAEVKRMTPTVLERCGVPMFTAGAFGFGSMMVNYRPGGMMEDEFARQVQDRSEHRPGRLASLVAQQFNPATVAIFDRARSTGPAPTTAIGCLLANTLLANEVIVHLLQGTELVDREAVFAPRFVTVDALSLNMQVIDASEH